MKIFIVVGDNEEEYECHTWWNEAVFNTKAKAKKYIKDNEEKLKRNNYGSGRYEIEEFDLKD